MLWFTEASWHNNDRRTWLEMIWDFSRVTGSERFRFGEVVISGSIPNSTFGNPVSILDS
jgi:hypothetical protein